MSIQFSRTTRALSIDSYRASRIGMILAILLLLLLVAWFFLAKITLYEISPEVTYTESGRILANFPAETIGRIEPGQAAIVRLSNGSEQQPVTLPAVVYGTDPTNNQVELLLMTNDLPSNLVPGALPGQAEVEVEYISPINLVMRASGRFLSQSRVPLSPQTTPDSGQ